MMEFRPSLASLFRLGNSYIFQFEHNLIHLNRFHSMQLIIDQIASSLSIVPRTITKS